MHREPLDLYALTTITTMTATMTATMLTSNMMMADVLVTSPTTGPSESETSGLQATGIPWTVVQVDKPGGKEKCFL